MSTLSAHAIHTFLSAVREAVRVHGDVRQLSALLTQAQGLMRDRHAAPTRGEEAAPEDAQDDLVLYERDNSDLAHIVASVLHGTAEEGVHRHCLNLLAALGAPGEAYAVHYLLSGQTRAEMLVGMVQGVPAEQRLLLYNTLLRRPRNIAGTHDPLVESLQRDLASVINEDPEEGLVLLDGLHRRGDTLCSVLQHAMLGSRFGLWLEELLRMELSAEQLAYMAGAVSVLRSRGLAALLVRHWPRMRGEAIIPLIRCVAVCSDPADERVLKLLIAASGHARPVVQDAALEALVALGTPEAGAPLAAALADRGVTPFLCALLLRLDERALAGVMRQVPSSMRSALVARLAATLSAFDRQGMLAMAAGMEMPATRSATGEEAAAQVRKFVSAHAEVKFAPIHEPSGPRAEPPEQDEEDDAGGLLSNVRSFFSRERKPEVEVHPLSLVEDGSTVVGQDFSGGSLTRFRLRAVTFEECSFTGVDMAFSVLDEVRFVRCRLHGVRLTESRLRRVLFQDSEAVLLLADRCRMERTRFEGTLFDTCDVAEARLVGCHMRNSALRGCRFWGSIWEGGSLLRTIVDASDFGCTRLQQMSLQGSLFGDCVFSRSDMRTVEARGTLFSGCSAAHCRVQEPDTDAPFLLEMADSWRDDALRAIADDMAGLQLPPASAGLYLLLQRWAQIADARRRRTRMLEQNRNRLSWCRAKLGRNGDMAMLLPLLLQSAAIPSAHGMVAALAAGIRGYEPNRAALDAMERRFGEAYVAPEYAPFPVEAVFFAGAAGTIAQTAGGPFEVWVLHDAIGEAAALIEPFREKLDTLAAWALQELHLVISFRLHHVRAVRGNRFGFEGTDSGDDDAVAAGVSQSLLLKAGLYRTMVLLAGRMPVWWCIPSALSDAEYAASLPVLEKGVDAVPLLDMGPLTSLPVQTVRGCLFWYIARALSVPFLSLLAFGQLEEMVAGRLRQEDVDDVGELLCNRIKRLVHVGQNGVWDVDPVAVPLRNMFAFYQAQGRIDVLELIRQAYLRKCGPAGMQASTWEHGTQGMSLGAEFLEYFMGFSSDPVGRKLADPAMQGGERAPSLLELQELGERLNTYLLETYLRVSGLLGLHPGGEVLRESPAPEELPEGVSGRDLSMAGRRIFAWLEPRPYKIMRLPLIEPPCMLLEGLEFQCEQEPGQPPLWSVQARLPKLAGRKAMREELRSDNQIAKLLCWLIANEYWRPGILATGSSLALNVSMRDIVDALEALYGVCAPVSFDRPWRAYLEDEQVVQAVVLVNFGVSREVRQIETASLIYLTSWGELFCMPDVPGAPALAEHAPETLTSLLHCPHEPGMELRLHLPEHFPAGMARSIPLS